MSFPLKTKISIPSSFLFIILLSNQLSGSQKAMDFLRREDSNQTLSNRYISIPDCDYFSNYLEHLKCFDANPVISNQIGKIFIVHGNEGTFHFKVTRKNTDSISAIRVMEALGDSPYFVKYIWKKELTNYFLLLLPAVKVQKLENAILEEDYFKQHKNIAKFMNKLLDAVQFVNKHKYVFIELNLENVLVNMSNMQPIFYDLEHLTQENSLIFAYNNINYIAPENLRKFINKEAVQYKIDQNVYALGVIYYALIIKQLPYEISVHDYGKIFTSKIRFSEKFYENEVDLIRHCLVVKQFRIDLETFRQKVFEIMIESFQYPIRKKMFYYITEKPRDDIGDHHPEHSRNVDLKGAESSECLEIGRPSSKVNIINTVLWCLLTMIVFGVFFVWFRLCCSKKSRNTQGRDEVSNSQDEIMY